MSDYKKTQKELKGPDEFQVKVMTWLDYLIKYKWHVGISVGAIALVMAAISGFKSYKEHQSVERSKALIDADLAYQNELEKADKEREQLQKQIDLANIGLDKEGVDPQKKALAEATTKDLQDKIKAIKASHSDSNTKYKEAYDKLKTHPEGWVAGLRYASSLLKDGKLAEGKAILSDILTASKDNPFYQVQAGISYIGVLEDLKEYDAAVTEIEKLLKIVSSEVKVRLLMAKGRIQLAKSQKAEAIQTFDSILKDYATSSEAEQARGMKALTNSL